MAGDKLLQQHQSTYKESQNMDQLTPPPSPFRPHFIKFSKTVTYEVNLTSQHSHLEAVLLSKF